MGYILADMTWPEVQEALKTVKVGIIPLGAHEQHGPHMNESCDAVLAEQMARRLVDRLAPYAVMTPAIPFGISIHHIHFPGTITMRPETLIAVLRDVVWSLQQHGLEQFLIVNSHGGNQSLLSVASAQLSVELGAKVYYAKTTAAAKQAISEHVQSKLYGHSCEREVSEALYMAPDIVRKDQLAAGDIQEGNWRLLRPGNAIQGFHFYDDMTRNGCIGNAPAGSRAAGEAIVEEALDGLEAAARQLFGLA
ncbi:creatininase family protein [Alicyclobacillus cycloheptanicus]|uniref:Creatinine amidohydrolase n=1 Tax=Alicyclobacillus cycloheptanicus TaxID=1457 RepID=A0ABT9XI16_9BACL|nr:creatininase family protein [Alicyclobacillus cycloheptanicus]MDQ0189959.1 creatinine amidohydrolase [Alicyclobacillus cycloheptanicus]WDM02145.1 creatininase family protein [Alicyclobacillus cycloheptanicus]